MTIEKDINNIFNSGNVNETLTKLGKIKGDIKYLTVLYCLESDPEDTYILMSGGTDIATSNLMLDMGKQAILTGTVVDDE